MVKGWAAALLVLSANACELLVDDGARTVASTGTAGDVDGDAAHGDASEAQAPEVSDAGGGSADITPGASAGCRAACVPAPPANWQGPYAIYEGMGSPLPVPPDCARAGHQCCVANSHCYGFHGRTSGKPHAS